MKKFSFYIFIILFSFQLSSFSETTRTISEGNPEAEIKLEIYESLTCSHCGDFHRNIYPELKTKYIDTGMISIEFKNFPLDLAALNASKIVHCQNGGGKDVMHFLYQNQEKWVKGSNILEVNSNLQNLLKISNININFEMCINDKNVEDFILEERIIGAKKYKIQSTPTLIINGKKFEKRLNFKNLDKTIKKML